MKRFTVIAFVLVMMLGLCQNGMAALINGTIDTTSDSAFVSAENGGYRYDYLISPTTFNLAPGTAPQTIYGTVTNLSFGSTSSWVEIGFVGEPIVNAGIYYSNPSYMFNQSAFFLVSRDSSNNIKVRPSDYNGYEGTVINLGAVTQFDYAFQITPTASGAGGNMTVMIGTHSSTLDYGVENWCADGRSDYGKYEFVYDSDWYYYTYPIGAPSSLGYVVAQGYTENLVNHPEGFVKADVTAAVPLPGALVLLGAGLVRLGFYRRRKTAAKS